MICTGEQATSAMAFCRTHGEAYRRLLKVGDIIEPKDQLGGRPDDAAAERIDQEVRQLVILIQGGMSTRKACEAMGRKHPSMMKRFRSRGIKCRDIMAGKFKEAIDNGDMRPFTTRK